MQKVIYKMVARIEVESNDPYEEALEYCSNLTIDAPSGITYIYGPEIFEEDEVIEEDDESEED